MFGGSDSGQGRIRVPNRSRVYAKVVGAQKKGTHVVGVPWVSRTWCYVYTRKVKRAMQVSCSAIQLSLPYPILCSFLFTLYVQVLNAICSDICMPCSAGRGSFLALSAAGHAGGPRVHHGANVGPGRTLWRALWAFKVARSGK